MIKNLDKSAYIIIIFLSFLTGSFIYAQEELPLLEISDLEYEGSFRLPSNTFGVSSMNYAVGALEYSSDKNSIFIVGAVNEQAIAEFSIPELVQSNVVSQLNMASEPVQNFFSVLDQATGGNPQNLDRIGGLKLIDGKLIVTAYEYYDAPADNTQNFLRIENSKKISSSIIEGFFKFQGGAAHTAGWISKIPSEWISVLNATHIAGGSSGIPIISRASVGPTAFAFNYEDLIDTTNHNAAIETTKLLDFSLEHSLQSDLSNDSLENDLWTHLSRAVYGFIVPGTRTYLTIGYSGGHQSGICYKCTEGCGGYCANDSNDYYHYYWLWDLNDLLKVKNGLINSYDVLPYDYGIFPSAFVTNEIGGASFDAKSGRLYISLLEADREQGDYDNPPIIAVYKTNADSESDSVIGKIGKKTYHCIQNTPENLCRIDVGSSAGENISIGLATRKLKKALTRIKYRILNKTGIKAILVKKRRSAKKALHNARLCKRNQLN